MKRVSLFSQPIRLGSAFHYTQSLLGSRHVTRTGKVMQLQQPKGHRDGLLPSAQQLLEFVLSFL